MGLSIHTKLFLTLLLACVAVLLGTQAFVDWSFRRGLVELADAREQQRLEQIAAQLTDIYRREHSWAPLLDDPQLWIASLQVRRDDRFEPRPNDRFPDDRPPGRPPEDGPPEDRPPDERPLRRRPPIWLPSEPIAPDDWPPLAPNEQPPRIRRPLPLEMRLMLLDGSGKILYGRRSLLADTRRYPLALDGEHIGELAILPGPPIHELAELRFRANQGDRLWIIVLAMLFLAAILAYPLSRRLVKPVRVFQEATRRLAAGDFGARVPTRGDDEISRLGRDINHLAAALQQTEEARRRWVADISHELRTPIALLRAELEALQDGVRPLRPEAMDALHSDVLRLGRLVDDLYELTTTDIGALAYRLEEIDVREVLSADIDAFRHPFAESGLALTLEDSLPGTVLLQADAQRLSQLFRNLLRNSLQYTDAGGELTVGISQNGGTLCLDFQDTAPAVPPESLPRLFERLYRVDASRSRHTGGAGLGLAIVKNIVEAHGGTIRAAQSPSGGLWIHIGLPI